MLTEKILVDDMDVIRNTLRTKGLPLTLRVFAQAIRLNAAEMKQGEIVETRINKDDIVAEYERIADRLDNQATGLHVNIRKLIEIGETKNATAETEGT